MAVIYLRHPDHGVKVATMDLEAEYDEQNGWERFDVDVTSENAIVRRRRQPRSKPEAESSSEHEGVLCNNIKMFCKTDTEM